MGNLGTRNPMKALLWTTCFLLPMLVLIWSQFIAVDITAHNNQLSEVKIFPPIEPYKCLQTNELYGGIKAKICLKPLAVDQHISRRFDEFGSFEGGKVSVVLKAMSMYPTAMFLDLGSNIGAYTVMVAAAGREVVAVDAMIENLAYIHQSLTLTNTRQFVRLLNNAVSNKKETLFPVLQDKANQGATHLVPESFITEKLKAVGPPVYSITLQDLLNFINKDIVIVKMDVEGYECKVLYNYLIDDHHLCYIPYINMEWANIKKNSGSNCPDLQGLVDALYSANYQPFVLPGNEIEDQGVPSTLELLAREDIKNNKADILWAHTEALALFW